MVVVVDVPVVVVVPAGDVATGLPDPPGIGCGVILVGVFSLVYLHAPLDPRVDDLAVAPHDPTVLALRHPDAAKHVSMATLESMMAGLRFGVASECQPNPRRENRHQP